MRLATSSEVSRSSSAPSFSGSLDSARVKAKALQRELNEMKTSSVFNSPRDLNQVDSAALLSEGFARLKKKLIRQEVEEFLIQKIVKGMISEKVDPDKNDEVFDMAKSGLFPIRLKLRRPCRFQNFKK